MESIRRMATLQRFYRLFPVILLVLMMAGCAAPKGGPWSKGQQQAAPDTVPPAGQTAAIYPTPTLSGAQAVKVAILLPLSGPHAAVGNSMLQAAQLAIFDLGYDNVELMPRDTGGTAGGASTAANAALGDGAQLILGPLLAEEVRAAAPIAANRGVNVIAFSTDWTLAGGNTYLLGFTPFGQVERIAAYAAEQGIRRAAVVSNSDAYGSAASSAFETEASGRGIAISRALSDPSAYDAVFLPAGGDDLARLLVRVPNKSAQKLGTGLWDDARTAALPDMEGAWFAAPSPKARAGFEQRYQATYGTKPVRIATLAYDATALAAALIQSGMKNGGKPAFTRASLANPSGFAGVDGILRFNKDGLSERGLAVLGIKGGRVVELDAAPQSFTQ